MKCGKHFAIEEMRADHITPWATARNADTFGYNACSEVTAANVSSFLAAYGYDEIGNSTNWTANGLNQYATQFTIVR